MDRKVLEEQLKTMSVISIAATAGCSRSTVRHWMKKYGLSSHHLSFSERRSEFRCACGEINPSKFYGRKKRVCSACHLRYTIIKGRSNREKIVDFLGGKCSACGFDRFLCALDVHHTDADRKDPAFSTHRGWSWNRIVKELKNCVLLCKNCHSAVHAGVLTIETEQGVAQ